MFQGKSKVSAKHGNYNYSRCCPAAAAWNVHYVVLLGVLVLVQKAAYVELERVRVGGWVGERGKSKGGMQRVRQGATKLLCYVTGRERKKSSPERDYALQQNIIISYELNLLTCKA